MVVSAPTHSLADLGRHLRLGPAPPGVWAMLRGHDVNAPSLGMQSRGSANSGATPA